MMSSELSRVVSERDTLAAQIKADALTLNDKIQHATKQGKHGCVILCFIETSYFVIVHIFAKY